MLDFFCLTYGVQFNVAGRLLTERNALDLEKTYAYDEMGNLTSITSPSGAKTSLSYTKLD
ncbi:RHS repeat domain-containing protein, partial [Streptococcus suis]